MDEPLLDKMQQLMGKYQASSLAPETAIQGSHPPDGRQPAFPVLTDIVKLGDAVFQAGATGTEPGSQSENAAAQSGETADQIARQILAVIDAQLKTQIDTLITPRLKHAMDETLAVLLPQLVVNIEAVIHETIVAECNRRGITFQNDENR
ncbi:MAG TPA: hypothetical protein VFN66_07320 [Burkholderiales bacterium]|nr:hypothetical protein [Burkholderiales bacterium]